MTEVVYISVPSKDKLRPWWAEMYYAEGVTKTRRRIPVGGKRQIAVTNASRSGLMLDIEAAKSDPEIGKIFWGGPPEGELCLV